MRNTKSTSVQRDANEKGFSLIEVLIAMAIFAVGFLALASMQVSATNGNTLAPSNQPWPL